MKLCRYCEVMIPDHARHCPHCRARQPGGQKLFQMVLVAVVAIAAALALWGGL